MRLWHRMRSPILFWITGAYVALVFLGLAYRTFVPQEGDREARAFFLHHSLRVAQPLLRDNRSREAAAYLQEAVKSGLIDGYQLEPHGKQFEKNGSMPEHRPVLTETISQVDGWVWGKVETADATLWMASGYGWSWRLARALSEEGTRMFLDLALLAIAWLVGVSVMQRPRRREAAVGVQDISVANPTPPVESRIHSFLPKKSLPVVVKAPPLQSAIEVDGTCVRTALANFSEISHSLQDGVLFERLDAFFSDCSVVISRYQGKVHAVQGHEILYYFSGENPLERVHFALAAARDLERIAEKHGLRLLTAISDGRLHGGQVFRHFTLLGVPLEETAELLLTSPPDAGRNFIWVSPRVMELSKKYATFRQLAENGRTLPRYLLLKLGEIEDVVLAAKRGDCANLAFHRGDADLVKVLESLNLEKDWRRENYVGAMGQLRRFFCERPAKELVDSYRALLKSELESKDSYRLSAVLALAPHVLSRESIDAAMEKLFLHSVALKDSRVRANAVEVFTRFFPEREVPELRTLLKDEDNRVSANALVKAALERFDDRLIAKIEGRVRGGSVAHVASALYALGEIAAYYRKNDPLFLGTKTSFLRIFNEIPAWAAHPNPMIRRQALQAAQKLNDPSLDHRLRQMFEENVDPDLGSLFASIYGWRKSEAKVA